MEDSNYRVYGAEIALLRSDIGKDVLNMEEKDRFPNAVRELNEDEKVVKDWMWEENDRLRYYEDLRALREQKLEKIVINLLNEGSDYNFISRVTGKTIEEIKEIESYINDL